MFIRQLTSKLLKYYSEVGGSAYTRVSKKIIPHLRIHQNAIHCWSCRTVCKILPQSSALPYGSHPRLLLALNPVHCHRKFIKNIVIVRMYVKPPGIIASEVLRLFTFLDTPGVLWARKESHTNMDGFYRAVPGSLFQTLTNHSSVPLSSTTTLSHELKQSLPMDTLHASVTFSSWRWWLGG